MRTLKNACKPRSSVLDAARRDTVLDLSDFAILRFLAGLSIAHWRQDAGAALLVAGAVENNHV